MKFLSDRPWIWVIIAHLAIIGVLTTMVVISKRYGISEVSTTVTNNGR